MVHAGFWKRFAAYLIDSIPIVIVVGLIFYFFFGFDNTFREYLQNKGDINARREFMSDRNSIRNISFNLWLIYCILMETSKFQGTFGKKLLGIKVVDANGNKLSFGRSLARNTSKILSVLVLGLGVFWIAFSKKKQGWHDLISSSFVVKNLEQTNTPENLK